MPLWAHRKKSCTKMYNSFFIRVTAGLSRCRSRFNFHRKFQQPETERAVRQRHGFPQRRPNLHAHHDRKGKNAPPPAQRHNAQSLRPSLPTGRNRRLFRQIPGRGIRLREPGPRASGTGFRVSSSPNRKRAARRAALFAYCLLSAARISLRRILPLMVLGSDSTNSITRGYL